jgi:hypothetical protein
LRYIYDHGLSYKPMFRINLDVLNKALNNSVMCLDACVDVAAQRLGGLYNIIIFIVFFCLFCIFLYISRYSLFHRI